MKCRCHRKKLGDKAKGHTVVVRTFHLKKIIIIQDRNLKLLIPYRIVYVLNVLCV